MRHTFCLLIVVIALMLLALPSFASPAGLQQQDSQDPLQGDRLNQPTLPLDHSKNLPDEEPLIRMQKEQQKKANEARQLHLKTDTDKLFKLASELKEQVDKTNENILSLDVVKKADEIERLAHSVKEKMRGEN